MDGLRKSYGTHFASRRVAENYRFRPPYPPEAYDTLLSLIGDGPRTVLDAGCGPGKLALGLIDCVDRIDAVDPSEEMLRIARADGRGDNPKINWIQSRTEDAVLAPPYGLVVAGASIHWMDLDTVLTRFAQSLAPSGVLAMIDGDAPVDSSWDAEEWVVLAEFIERLQGAPPRFPKSRLEGLEQPILEHARFLRQGRKITAPWALTQTVDDYLRCQHSRATWAEHHMGAAMTEEFDARLRAVLEPHARDGVLTYDVRSRMEWGKPLMEPANILAS